MVAMPRPSRRAAAFGPMPLMRLAGSGQVRPEARKLTYHIHMKRVILRKLVMGIADANLEVDGRTIYTGKDLRVGLFTSTDGF